MTEQEFKSKLNDMLNIINLSPARQSQVYFNIVAKVPNKTITLTPTVEYFDNTKTRFAADPRHWEAEFHIGLAIGCFEVWLKENNIQYTRKDNFQVDDFITMEFN